MEYLLLKYTQSPDIGEKSLRHFPVLSWVTNILLHTNPAERLC